MLFQNRDGTKTLRIYDYPVKFKDSDGKIKDKSTKIISSDTDKYKYRNESNDIITYFPEYLTNDSEVLLKYNSCNIGITPASGKMKNSYGLNAAEKSRYTNDFNVEEDAVIYDDVFGDGTLLRYTPLFTGIKEDIILEKDIGVNEFSFVIKTGGLAVNEENGSYSIDDPVTGEKIMRIGEIEVYDSRETSRFERSKYEHKAEVTVVSQNEEYIFTVIVDRDFLTDENTVYPVTVDPSFYESGADMVEASIYKPTNTLSTKYVEVGAVTEFSAVGRMLVDFPGLYNNRIYKGLTADQIESASYNVYAYGHNDIGYMKAYTYAGSEWSSGKPTNVAYSDGVWNSIKTTAKTYKIPTSPSFTQIDITNTVKYWRNGTYPERGLILVNSFEDSIFDCIRVYTREYFLAQMRAPLTVTYSNVTKVYPLVDTEHHIRLSRGYSGDHKALDIVSTDSRYSIQGAEIRCPINGRVIDSYKDPKAGYYICVESSELVNKGNNFPVRFTFCHLTAQSKFAKDDIVSVDDILGYVGNTGADWNGYHLHVSQMASDHVWYTNPDSVARDPKSFFKPWLEK